MDLAEALRTGDDLADITQEWVEEMEEKIEASLLDVEASIQHLTRLCKLFLTADKENRTAKTQSTGNDN